MSKLKYIFTTLIFFSLLSVSNSNILNKKIDEIEKQFESNNKMLSQFITYFDKRIMWLEENFNGINANYTSCCKDIKKNNKILFILQTLVNDHLNIKNEF